jgi:hypothetical protein
VTRDQELEAWWQGREARERDRQSKMTRLQIEEKQLHELHGWIYDVEPFDNAYDAAGARPLPEPLESIARELLRCSESEMTAIGEALYGLFGTPGMKVLLYRVSNQSRGRFYQVDRAYSGIGGWQV